LRMFCRLQSSAGKKCEGKMAKITEYLELLLAGRDLSFSQSQSLLDVIFEGQVADVQIAAFLAAMRVKNATAEELAGFAQSLREHAVRVRTGIEPLVDTCGTGGALAKTTNISTAAALVAAGAGLYVAKHGNRGITSKCGSADVLAELGVRIDAPAEVVAECIRQAHIGFMFAPRFHPAMKYVQPVRRDLDFRTAFNVLGPLANPAGAQRQVLGVAEEHLLKTIGAALKRLGTEHAMVVHSNGTDEIGTTGVTQVVEVNRQEVRRWQLNARDFGFSPATCDQPAAKDAESSARLLRDILGGAERGPCRDMVVLNAAAAIVVGGFADDFAGGISMAADSIDEGRAMTSLEKLIEISNGGQSGE